MAKTSEDQDIDFTYTVKRPSPNVIAVFGKWPPLMDMHGLMREWYHAGWRYVSLALARLWGASVVVCRSSGDEAEILRESECERSSSAQQGPAGPNPAEEGP